MSALSRRFARTPVAHACAALFAGAVLGAAAPPALAATPAGEQIKNLATVTYQDAAGNTYSAQSNEAVVTVAQVYSATVGQDVDKTAVAGQVVYLPFTLTNTGNGPDDFALGVANGITGGDDLDAATIELFRDVSGNGVPDGAEPAIAAGTPITLAAGAIENLVVAVTVPAGATNGQTLGVTLTAEAFNGTGAAVVGSVEDVSTSAPKGRDGADGTNESLITVTGDAVLVVSKASSHDVANRRITYTVSVRNDGNRPAKDVVLFDGLPAGTTYVSSSVSGIQTNLGDTVSTSVADLADESALNLDLNADGSTATPAGESALGIDLNQDGSLDDATVDIPGVYAVDSDLAVGAEVSLTVVVGYAPGTFAGGHTFRNVGYASGDTDTAAGNDSLVASGLVSDTIASAYGVRVDDTGDNAADAINDGQDDDASNDDQYVSSAAAGGIVLFTAVVTNVGNSDDVFDLTLNPGDFPVGTVFTFHDEATGLALANGAGASTGTIAPGDTQRIEVRAALPSNAPASATEVTGSITATSRLAPAGTVTSDSMDFSLGAVVVARADLKNSSSAPTATNADALDAAPYTAVQTFDATIGTTVDIPLYIDNESDAADSYKLYAGSSWDAATSTLGGLPSGWSVEFHEVDGSGNPVGPALTGSPDPITPTIPVGGSNFQVIARVTIPNDAALAVDDLLFDRDADGTPERLARAGQSDGDYPIFFRIQSANTGATDIKLDAIDVAAARDVTLLSGGNAEVEPGGSVTYEHVLRNAGSSSEVLAIASGSDRPDFIHTLSIDTNGDGVPDQEIDDLSVGNITVRQPDGTDVTIAVTIDGAGVRRLELPPGAALPLSATVFAPADADAGEIDTLTITATNTVTGGPGATVGNRTTVIDSKLRLIKTVAFDALCDGAPDGAFETVLSAQVAPEQCVVWNIEAENIGTENALNVKVVDAAPLFSSLVAGSLEYCAGAGCSPADAGPLGLESDPAVTFHVGAGATAGAGGTLAPGGFVTVRFGVRVD